MLIPRFGSTRQAWQLTYMGKDERALVNGGQVFVPITNADVWKKVLELERRVDALSVKLYAFATSVVIIAGFLSLTGGVSVGK